MHGSPVLWAAASVGILWLFGFAFEPSDPPPYIIRAFPGPFRARDGAV